MFEPTGPYNRLLELALLAAGLHLVKVNPRSARRFAESTGVLTMTENQYDLKELGVARRAKPAASANTVT